MQRRDFLKTGLFAGTGIFMGSATASSQTRTADALAKATKPGPLVMATYRPGLDASRKGFEVLARGGSVVSAVEEAVKLAEADPKNGTVGFGGRPNRDGVVELDAAIMNGANLEAGSVAGMQNIKHPISVARRVMEETVHVMLVGDGARRFAVDQGFREENLLTEESKRAWESWKEKQARPSPTEDDHDTMAALALDRAGNVAAACTTSGWAFKIPGRVGDSPLIGPGLYCDNKAGAAAATGLGEEIIKVCGSYQVVEFMRQGLSPNEAIRRVLERVIARDPDNRNQLIAFIAIRADGAVGLGSANDRFSAAVARDDGATMIQCPKMDESHDGK